MREKHAEYWKQLQEGVQADKEAGQFKCNVCNQSFMKAE